MTVHRLDRGERRSRLTRRTALGLALGALAPALAGCTVPFAPTLGQRGVFVADREGQELRRIAPGSPWLAWSSDSRRLALRYEDGTIRVAGADGSGSQPYQGGAYSGPGWSPSGTELAVIDAEQNLIRIVSTSGTVLGQAPLREPLPPLWSVAVPRDNIPRWSPDGTAIAFLAWDGHGDALYTISPAGTNRRKLTDVPITDNRVDRYDWLGQRAAAGDVGTPAWSPDGRLLAYALFPEGRGSTGGIFTVPAAGGRPTRVTDQHPTSGPDWSPAGGQLVYAARDGAESSIFAASTTGDDIRNLTVRLRIGAWRPAWSPDGRYLAFAGGSELFVMSPDGSIRPVASTGLVNQRLLWSPDSSRIAFLGVPAQPGR